jgi:hypothetical protein
MMVCIPRRTEVTWFISTLCFDHQIVDLPHIVKGQKEETSRNAKVNN